jgi:hypothetical protein
MPHPSYLSVTFTQTAPISGGYHESVIDLSGAYSVPSAGTSSQGCEFRGLFTRQYADAIPSNPPGFRTLYVTFRIDVIFSGSSKSVAVSLTGAQLNAEDTGSRASGLYAITLSTGDVLPLTGIAMSGGNYNTIITPDQFVDFYTCEDSVAASRQAYSMNGNQIAYANTSVQCGTFSWSSP